MFVVNSKKVYKLTFRVKKKSNDSYYLWEYIYLYIFTIICMPPIYLGYLKKIVHAKIRRNYFKRIQNKKKVEKIAQAKSYKIDNISLHILPAHFFLSKIELLFYHNNKWACDFFRRRAICKGRRRAFKRNELFCINHLLCSILIFCTALK